MKAIVISHFGPSVDNLVFRDIEAPEPTLGRVVIRVKAFGINHAEMHMRKGEWAESMPVSGIECVGIVHACPGGEFIVGAKVAALMGGMGRTINGSYAEFTNPPVGNVCVIESDLPWEQLAALPETYATAWTCLFRNLEVKAGQLVLVRGATSSFGQAAVNLAVNAGAKVIGTTRNEARFEKLKKLGAFRVELEGPDLSKRLAESGTVDAVLNLVGNSVLLDSMNIPRRGGRHCLAGFLGGLAPVPDFNPLAQLPSGVHFSFFGSFHFGTPEFPLSDVPLQSIARDVADGKFEARPARVFGFKDVREAHKVMEANEANGKLVVVVD
ncbi:Zn-dependent oxidoreductase [Collybia nuda]|uniref:Zn-dependent oxidoreductase n=1 Tax=Collybia nuda TaxID=64659 RepID=A0A9P5Y468_9AGAR|nr:Zn-dependent oxidoreductase [Collybia nuda]